jgi:hypothetical protein
MKYFIILSFLVLASCSSASGIALESVIDKIQGTSDKVLIGGERIVCEHSSVRAVGKRYWDSKEKMDAWFTFCVIDQYRAIPE